MSWYDDGVRLKAYVSTAGDFVSLGTTTVYPFTAGGSGYPAGWTQYLSGGAVAGDVSWTTDSTTGRFSIGNLGDDIHTNKYYGIYRDFPATAGKRYLIQIQCRTTANRTTCIRYFVYRRNGGLINYTQVWSYQDWEQISLYTGVMPSGTTSVGMHMYAAPYNASAQHASVDANWGIQFQNPTIVEMEGTYPDPTWSEFTCDVRSATIHYGRDKFTNRYDVATCQLDLANDDGQWNYAGSTTDNPTFRPGRFIRVMGTYPQSGGEIYAYYGLIDSVGETYTLEGRAYTQFNCVDVSTLLSNTTVPTVHDQYDTVVSGSRFTALANASGWIPQFVRADGGVYSQQAVLANGRSVRDEMGLIADSEGGFFYADLFGRIQFHDRTWDARTHTKVQAELIAKRDPTYLPPIDQIPNRTDVWFAVIPLRDVQTEWSRDRVVNEVQVANAGGTAFITIDAASQQRYGPRTYQRLDFVNDDTHPEYLKERTNDFMAGYTDAILRVTQVQFTPRDRIQYSFCFYLEFGSLVRVRYEHPTELWGYVVVSRVQGWTHSIGANGGWVTTLNLDQPISFVAYTYTDAGWDVAHWDVDLWDEFGNETGYWDSGELWGDTTSPTQPISPLQIWGD